MRWVLYTTAFCTCAILPNLSTAATFTGDDASFEMSFLGPFASTTTTISDTADELVFTSGGGALRMDITGSEFSIFYDIPDSPITTTDGLVFSVTGLDNLDGAPITDLTLDRISGQVVPTGPSGLFGPITTTDDSLSVTMRGFEGAANETTSFTFNIVTAPVPLPAGAPLLATGLGAFAMVRRYANCG
ncbi:MAG: VPLPA-CTERM sorting domain-containing protein [Pseudomonadota bacterium]